MQKSQIIFNVIFSVWQINLLYFRKTNQNVFNICAAEASTKMFLKCNVIKGLSQKTNFCGLL